MMGLDFYRHVLEIVERHRRPGQVIEHTIQTNATLIDDTWATFLAEHDFLVGVSIDGPAHLHDVYRRDKGGKPTFDRVLRGLRTLQAHGVRWNALTTINSANEDHPLEVYRFLRDDLGASTSSSSRSWSGPRPERIPTGNQVTDRSVSPGGYGSFLSAVFDEWVRRDVGRVFVQMLDTTLANYLDVPGGMCVHARTCGTAVALEHTGDLYSCDHFVEPDHLLGNITDIPMLELISSPKQVAFGQAKHDDLPATAAPAASGSPATAAAPRTGSPPPPTASPDCTTCARASRRSSPTSTSRCGSWPEPCAPGAWPRRSWPGWPGRMHGQPPRLTSIGPPRCPRCGSRRDPSGNGLSNWVD